MESKFPKLLAPVTDGTLVVASDYSGQHKQASHEAYSFLTTTDLALKGWLPSLKAFREEWLPDNRRMSFKRLNEPVRWRALPAFLQLASALGGNLFTVLVDRRVGSFFQGGPDAAIDVFPDCFPAHVNRGTVEKMLRLASFMALILSGLRREDQRSNWISDDDEALDTNNKREQFGRLATYLTFGLTGWRHAADNSFGTTGSLIAPWWSEDVAAIAGLTAGAYCKMSDNLPAFFGNESWVVGMASNNIENMRARAIGNWLAKGRGSLKHVLLRLEQDGDGEVRASAQGFV